MSYPEILFFGWNSYKFQAPFLSKETKQSSDDLLTWSTPDNRHDIQCGLDGVFTYKNPEGQRLQMQTSSSIPSHLDQYYFECEVKCNVNVAVGLGFTEKDVEIIGDPLYRKNTLGIEVASSTCDNRISRCQYGKNTEVEDVKLLQDENAIGLLLKKTRLGEHQFCLFQSFINGIQVGHTSISDRMELYPSIWFGPWGSGDRTSSVKCNLGDKSFKFDYKTGNCLQRKGQL